MHSTPFWSCSTRATRSTDGPDDDSQQGPVARFSVADLEPASLRENVVREREKLHTTRIGSRRRNGARSA